MQVASESDASSSAKPGTGFAPWEMGVAALRPLGVAPTERPKPTVLAHEKKPGMKTRPGSVSRRTAATKASLTRKAQDSPGESSCP